MTYDAPLRGAQDAVIDTLMRGVQSQHLINDLVSRYINSDFLSRDENMRLGGARCANYLSGLDGRGKRAEELLCDDLIRRHVKILDVNNELKLTFGYSVNMIAQLANNQVSVRQSYAEIHPKMMSNGCYPREFERPCRVEEMLNADSQYTLSFLSLLCLTCIATILDRLLTAYNLPRTYNNTSYVSSALRNLTNYINSSNNNYSSDRGNKLSVLLEYLGVSMAEEYNRDNTMSGGLTLGRNRLGERDNLRLGGGVLGRRDLAY
jgi:hypothetical protein